MDLPRQKYWSIPPLPSPGELLTQELNLCLWLGRWMLYHGAPWEAQSFSASPKTLCHRDWIPHQSTEKVRFRPQGQNLYPGCPWPQGGRGARVDDPDSQTQACMPRAPLMASRGGGSDAESQVSRSLRDSARPRPEASAFTP